MRTLCSKNVLDKRRDIMYSKFKLKLGAIAGAVTVAFLALFIVGCSETTISPTAACCNDTCEAVHTCETATGCTDGCAKEPDPPSIFVWVCHNGNSKKIYDWQLDKHLNHGDTKGKCKGTPPGDDDDDDDCPTCPIGDDDDDDDSNDKVCICHIPPGNPSNAHTICIGAPAVPAHIANHGDYLGECK